MYIDDSSLNALANELKRQPMMYAAFTNFARHLRERRETLKLELKEYMAAAVKKYRVHAKSAADVKLYRENDLMVDATVRALNRKIIKATEFAAFASHMEQCLYKRNDALIALLKADAGAVIIDKNIKDAVLQNEFEKHQRLEDTLNSGVWRRHDV